MSEWRFVATGWSAAFALVAAHVAGPRLAWADGAVADKCIAAAEQSQPLQRDGKLKAARERLVECSRAECPSPVRADCTKWLAELDGVMPSVVVSAVDSTGADVVDVRVVVDGQELASRLEGREIQIDPGTHTIRFEREGSPPIEQQIAIREAERHRIVSITFAPPAKAVAVPPPSPTPETHAAGTGRSLAWPIAFFGVGAAGVGVASYFWLSGLADRSTMASGCAATHACSQSAVDSAHGKLVAGDVAAGVGVVAAAIGAGILLFGQGSPTREPAAAASIDARPLPGGAAFDVAGHF